MGKRILTGKEIGGTLCECTDRDLTLYIRSDGNDNNGGLTINTALATIQEAVDRLPKFIEHEILIDIGEGEFDGAILENFSASFSGKLTLCGTLGAFSTVTGSSSGVATGGNTSTLIDSAQNWTPNDLQGSLLLVDGEYRFIKDNDTTTIETVGLYSESVNGKNYEIVESKTIINASKGYGALDFVGCSQGLRTSFIIKDVKVTTGLIAGIIAIYGDPPYIERVYQSGSTYGVTVQSATGEIALVDVWIENNSCYGIGFVLSNTVASNGPSKRVMVKDNSSHGICLDNTKGLFLSYVYAMNNGGDGVYVSYCHGVASFIDYFCSAGNTGNGIQVWATQHIDFTNVDIYDNGKDGIKAQCVQFIDVDGGSINNNDGYGINIDENLGGLGDNRSAQSFINAAGSVEVSGNALGGIIAKNKSTVALTACTGTNVGGYGLELQSCSNATVTEDTDITGGDGDATVDAGTTSLSWTNDFSSDGNSVTNIQNLCIIERKD